MKTILPLMMLAGACCGAVISPKMADRPPAKPMAIVKPKLVTISWTHPSTNLLFKVYKWDIVPPQPYWTNISGKWFPRCDVVAMAWLTNKPIVVNITADKFWTFTPVSDGVLHLYAVTAYDATANKESLPATK